MTIELHGYRYSVYHRVARVALEEKGVAHDRVEVNPFAPDVPADYLAMHPFGRVPTLVHDGFVLHETCAITAYVDEMFAGASLQPDDARARARMRQIVSIVDGYGYRPMVRQVFSQRVFGPANGRPADESEIAQGLAASATVLRALEGLAADAAWLTGERFTLADIHLAPMMAYFAAAPEGAALLAGHRRLSAWWRRAAARASTIATEPGLPGAG